MPPSGGLLVSMRLKETASDSFYKVFVFKGGQQYAVYRRYQSGPEAA